MCGNISEPKTMSEIRSIIEDAVRKADAREKNLKFAVDTRVWGLI